MAQNPPHDARIVVDGRELDNWVEYSIESDLLTPADAFNFKIANPQGEFSSVVNRFDEVVVMIDGTVQMTGFVDDINKATDADSGTTLEVVGRDRFGQLADVSADPKTLTGLDLGQIAVKLGQPFVERWIFHNEDNRRRLLVARKRVAAVAPSSAQKKKDDRRARIALQLLPAGATPAARAAALERLNASNRAAVTAEQARSKALTKAKANLAKVKREVFPRIKVEPGDSPLEIITKAAERAELMVWMTADGQGVIARPTYDQAAVFTLWHYPLASADRQFNNVRSISWQLSGAEQFSNYRISGHSANNRNTSGTGSRQESSLTDSATTLARKKIIRGSGKSRRQAKIQLEREIQRRNFKSLVCTVEVPGHGQDDLLWQIDTLCAITDEVNGHSGQFYLTKRRFVGDEQGQRTELTFHQPRILLP